MKGKTILSVGVMFVMSLLLGFIVHALLLKSDYAQLVGLFRPEAERQAYFPYMLLGHLCIAVGFVWVYLQGRDDDPWLGQGIRYGAAIAVLMTIPSYLIHYAVQPMPGMVVVKQIVFDTVGVVLMGIVVAWLNR
jgi:hypothetical protein